VQRAEGARVIEICVALISSVWSLQSSTALVYSAGVVVMSALFLFVDSRHQTRNKLQFRVIPNDPAISAHNAIPQRTR